MDKIYHVIDLKKEGYFIEQYIQLRNNYTEVLLTSPVNISETKEWLKINDIEIRGLVQNEILLGAVILYIGRDGEIAFFVKDQNKGIGSKLLNIIKEVAMERDLESIWGWALKDNFIAQRVFEKNRFVREGIVEREYKGVIKKGIMYKKVLIHDPKR